MIAKPLPEEGDDMARPIASVHLDIARFSWEVGRLKSAMDRADWLEKFAEALVMRDPKIHQYAGTLLAEADSFREEKSQKARESANERWGKTGKKEKNANASDSMHSHASASDGMRSDATDRSDQTDQTDQGSLISGSDGKADGIAFARRVIAYLNEKAGKAYRIGAATQKLIQARQAEAFTEEDFRRVIDIKVAEWKGTEMDKYLRPETLFRASKMDGYLNQSPEAKRQPPPSHGGGFGRQRGGYDDDRPDLDFLPPTGSD